MLINTSKISSISIANNKYYINMVSINIDGFLMLGSGSIGSHQTNIVICKESNTDDYNIINKWINTVTK